jgi:biopolymer transport protein ExbD
MGAVDIGGGKERPHKGKKGPRPRKRVGIRIDMTPMVDVAFLLLIFFMVTTVFRTPQALEINLPPKDIVIPIAQSNILTLRVLPGEKMFYNVGEAKPVPIALSNLPPVLKTESGKNSRLVVLIKIDKDAKFHSMVDVIDELDLAKVTRFSMAPLTDEEKKEVETL